MNWMPARDRKPEQGFLFAFFMQLKTCRPGKLPPSKIMICVLREWGHLCAEKKCFSIQINVSYAGWLQLKKTEGKGCIVYPRAWVFCELKEGGGRLQEAFIRAFLNENIIFRFLDFITSPQSLFFLCNFFSLTPCAIHQGPPLGTKSDFKTFGFVKLSTQLTSLVLFCVCPWLQPIITILQSWDYHGSFFGLIYSTNTDTSKAKKEQKRRKEVCKVDY